MDITKKKVIFIDMDGTLIDTVSGKNLSGRSLGHETENGGFCATQETSSTGCSHRI